MDDPVGEKQVAVPELELDFKIKVGVASCPGWDEQDDVGVGGPPDSSQHPQSTLPRDDKTAADNDPDP